MKKTPPEEEPVLDGARSSRGEEGAQHQFDGARPDAGAPRLARLTARARERRTSARRASPGLPQSGDPSALRARAPSLTHQPPTARACLTPLQASTSRAWPRAASAARWAAGRRQAGCMPAPAAAAVVRRPPRLCMRSPVPSQVVEARLPARHGRRATLWHARGRRQRRWRRRRRRRARRRPLAERCSAVMYVC